MTGLRAIMVAVDYEDLLAVTLPYNRHHFDEIHIVTDSRCYKEVMHVVMLNHRDRDDGTLQVYKTDLFYADGASFNKWRALEWGLDQMGRRGWICLMDADVLWPKKLEIKPSLYGQGLLSFKTSTNCLWIFPGQLMAPLRRMAPWPTQCGQHPYSVAPAEQLWSAYPIHRNVNEWAGYSQIFHADDPHLGSPPWHEIDWVHAGGADSLFQRKWPREAKVRPNWEVLHLGEPGQNWYGRATVFADGSEPVEAQARRQACAAIWHQRRAVRAAGGDEAASFAPEKLRRTTS